MMQLTRWIFPAAFGLALAAEANASETVPVSKPAASASTPSLARCPRLKAEETADRARTAALAIPAEFRWVARANVNHIAVATLSGGTVCVSTGYVESIGALRLTRDERFLHFPWHGNEAGGYFVVDRTGQGHSVDTGAIPTFSPSRARFASIEISESGFGSLNGFLVMAVDPSGMRQLAKLTDIPMLTDWRIHEWVGESCINLSGIRQEDVPDNWANLGKASRVRYAARAGPRGWSLTPSTGGCAAR
jgi:hypothetical protein